VCVGVSGRSVCGRVGEILTLPPARAAGDPVSRLFFMSCNSCGCTRSVQPVKAGFTAVKKGERRKARIADG
jgi:hypothetical protein